MATEALAKPRIDALDQTKGLLVVAMVIYHSLNRSSQYYLGFRYLSFLPPSFIFISGFLLSNVYSGRLDFDRARVYKRLLIRGTKLLLLFSLLNVVTFLAGRRDLYGRPLDLDYLFDHWYSVYVTGIGRIAAFEVLLPIAYLLLAAPLLLWIARIGRFTFPLFAAAAILGCTYLDQSAHPNLILNLMAAGILGMALGRQSIQSFDILGRYCAVAAIAYCLYFPIGIAAGYNYLLQLLGALISLAAAYGISVRFSGSNWAKSRLTQLGRYSLISYILQIGVLQLSSHLFQRPYPWSLSWFIMFGVTLFSVMAIVALVDAARARARAADKIYKLVFG